MGKQLTERQVLEKLDIPDFRHITKDKVMEFASMLNKMEPDVAKKAIEQFPEFARMALAALKDYRAVMDKTLDSSDKSTKRCYDIYDEVVSALKACLKQDNLPFEEKKYYIEKMMEVARMSEKKDSENKHFNWGLVGAAAAVVVTVIGIGASALGVDIHLPGGKT